MNIKKEKTGRVKKTMLIALIVIAALITGIIAFRLIYREVIRSQNTIKSETGIDLMETIEIGGINQILYFRGQNIDNPVILYIHGGPGSPETQLLHGFQYSWEDDFTVVHWEQRQAGKTYLANNPTDIAGYTSFERMLEDAWEVTQYVQEKLDKDKVIVLGHSWGTVLGLTLVQSHPEAFLAYIGVGQIINWRENEHTGYNLTYDKAREAGNKKDIAVLEAMESYLTEPYNESTFQKFMQLSNLKNKYGVGNGANDSKLMLISLGSPYCSFRELMLMFSNEYWSHQDKLFRYLSEFDAYQLGTEYTISVFFIQGAEDYLVSSDILSKFYDEICAPEKEMFVIENAGHMTMTDNPEEFAQVLLEEIKPRIAN